jgi:hypothetical protein
MGGLGAVGYELSSTHAGLTVKPVRARTTLDIIFWGKGGSSCGPMRLVVFSPTWGPKGCSSGCSCAIEALKLADVTVLARDPAHLERHVAGQAVVRQPGVLQRLAGAGPQLGVALQQALRNRVRSRAQEVRGIRRSNARVAGMMYGRAASWVACRRRAEQARACLHRPCDTGQATRVPHALSY